MRNSGGVDRTRPSFAFADVPKLELDQLIDQLVDRAQEVKRAQGRLRALLRATDMINSDLSLERVLRQIAEAACYLAEAKYAALGVFGPDGGLDEFVHVGVEDDDAPGIGDLPQGEGLLGALLTDPRPIRINRDDPGASGARFPGDNPSMSSFLGVPIRVRGEVYGNLYLTESLRGEFTAEDEELVASLASAAGTAISNARVFHESRVQQRWLAASVDIAAQLLASSGEDPLHTIARHASDITEADLVSVGILTSDESAVLVEVAIGDQADVLLGRRYGLDGTLAGRAIAQRAPLMVRTMDLLDSTSPIVHEVDVGPAMVIPLMAETNVHGVLIILRRRNARAFSHSDLEMAAGFASQASVALELATARADQQRVELLEDRDRIARDLHDHVIQQLFAIGLSLQGLAATAVDTPELSTMLEERVEDLDRTIRQIRTTIFALRNPGGPAQGLRGSLLAIGAELTPALGTTPGFTFAGAVDTIVTGSLAEDVRACVREALTNIAKFAHARRTFVDVTADSSKVTVRVFDDGRGMPDDVIESGLHDLRDRAERRGGSLFMHNPTTGGSELVWKAPIT